MVTGSYQKVDWDVLDATVARFNTERGQIEQTGEALRQEILTNLSAVWTGNASTAYQSAYLKWKQGYDQSVAVLDELIVAVNQARNFHEQSEAQRAANIQSF